MAAGVARLLCIVTVLAVPIGCASSASDEPSCDDMAAHLIELRLEDVAAADIDSDRHRANLQRAVAAAQREACVADFAPVDVRCVLAAQTSDEAAACIATLAERTNRRIP